MPRLCEALVPAAPLASRSLSTIADRAPRPGGRPLLYDERDVEEVFVRGGGPGGQAVAKTSNCVVLRHVPSGLRVRCHATRSRETNRLLARRELQLRLDELHEGPASVRATRECVPTHGRRRCPLPDDARATWG